MAKQQSKTNEAPFERYARTIQADIAALRNDMATKQDLLNLATKQDLLQLRSEMATHSALLGVADDVKRLNQIMVSKADLAETIRRELDASPYAKEADVKDLRERILRVEEKLGINPARRAA